MFQWDSVFGWGDAITFLWLFATCLGIWLAYRGVSRQIRSSYSQRWWEMRVGAYTEIMRDFARMKRCLDEWTNAQESARELPEDREAGLQNDYREARRKISCAAQMGEFVLSAKVVNLLNAFERDLAAAEEKAGSSYESLDSSWGVVRERLDELIQCAREDLQVPAKALRYRGLGNE